MRLDSFSLFPRCAGVESFSSTLHWGPWAAADAWPQTHGTYSLPEAAGDLADGMHTYGLYWNSSTLFTYIDSPANVVMSVDLSKESFWGLGGWGNSTGSDNPWADSPNNVAPFDGRFYLILEIAVGGTGGYFPDNVGGKPWSDGSPNAVNEFYAAASSQWLPSWPTSASARSNSTAGGQPFRIDSVRVWQGGDSMQGAEYGFRPML